MSFGLRLQRHQQLTCITYETRLLEVEYVAGHAVPVLNFHLLARNNYPSFPPPQKTLFAFAVPQHPLRSA
jgi:hypothetical protein